ncbi:alpha amylase C-terminal domain-containing protein, partial [bacterium]|nr:alpha amylase C-terminal domain-containing protein [bacterium]
GSKVIAQHLKDNATGSEMYSVANFENVSYPRNGVGKYYISFPEGVWQEVINTDDAKYGGKNRINLEPVQGGDKRPINLGQNSTIIFKRVG